MSMDSDTALSHSMGQKGFKYLTTAGTATHNTSKSCAIQAVADSTISCTSVVGDNLSAVSVTAGTIIVGRFSSVTIAGAGGSAIVYLS